MKTTSNLTSLIIKNSNNRFVTIFDRIPAIIASLFSVLFALSITLELKSLVSGVVLFFLIVFIILFLILNEVIKVKMIKRSFNSVKSAIIPFVITFILSCSLSSIGVYFWTNKTVEIKDNSIIEKTISINDIKQKYNSDILNLNNQTFEDSKEFETLQIDLNYWKTRRPANVDERADIRKKIDAIQNRINVQRDKYNINKQTSLKQINDLMTQEIQITEATFNSSTNKMNRNNFVSYIFFILIIITEFAIIILNKILVEKENKLTSFLDSEHVQRYLIERNMLISLYMTANENNVTNINKAKYSPVNSNNVLEWNEITAMYNRFISLGILSNTQTVDNVLTNNIDLREEQALILFDSYYDKYFKTLSI